MKNKITTMILGLAFLLLPLDTLGDEIEEIVVVGSFEQVDATDVSQDFTIIETVMPAMAFTAGGYGGFAGFNERGTQTVHTTVFRNGVPANDAGSGWYDFGHDLVSGLEDVKVISGPNGVLYGSGSLGGTVFINDNLSNQAVLRVGDEHHTLVNVTVLDSLSFTHFDVSNGSVKTDNEEEDFYVNSTAKFVKEINGVTIATSYTDYEYDYDSCYTASFSQSNDCMQAGEKVSFSLRNENLTVGYNSNNSDYYTEGVSTFDSDAERWYVDAREVFEIGSPAADLVLGVTANQDKYAGFDRDDFSVYAMINWEDRLQLGTRVSEDAIIYRGGYASNGFFVNASTSYRNPTLYELNGDAWVQPNAELDPEEALGWEIGYLGFTYFNYRFREGIDYDFSLSQYVNTGEYDSRGMRYVDQYQVPWGAFSVMAGYTDTDQPRVPKYKGRFSYFISVADTQFELVYTAQFDRQPGPYDGEFLEDVKTVDFVVTRNISTRLAVNFTVQDLFDKEIEILPGYGAGGRNIFLTLTYR